MAVGDAGALYLMENGYPNFLSLTYGVPKLDELEEVQSELDLLHDEQQASYERMCELSLKLCKKYKKQRRRIKEAGRYIDQSDTITCNDKENFKKILHIKYISVILFVILWPFIFCQHSNKLYPNRRF